MQYLTKKKKKNEGKNRAIQNVVIQNDAKDKPDRWDRQRTKFRKLDRNL